MKTVKVRVCAVVGSNGRWNAFGPCEDPSICADGIDDPKTGKYPTSNQVYWLTADLPIPEETDVSASVVPEEDYL